MGVVRGERWIPLKSGQGALHVLTPLKQVHEPISSLNLGLVQYLKLNTYRYPCCLFRQNKVLVLKNHLSLCIVFVPRR